MMQTTGVNEEGLVNSAQPMAQQQYSYDNKYSGGNFGGMPMGMPVGGSSGVSGTLHYSYTPYFPPQGQWTSQLCDCCTNLWPSCCGVFMGGYAGFFIPLWFAGQISTQIKWISTKNVLLGYAGIWAILFIAAVIILLQAYSAAQKGDVNKQVQLTSTANNLIYIPAYFAVLFLIVVRFKFVEYYKIQEHGCLTCLQGWLCWPCSLCQMMRHQYGYKVKFDGDSKLDGGMNYQPITPVNTAMVQTANSV